jgi:hypothetical protein
MRGAWIATALLFLAAVALAAGYLLKRPPPPPPPALPPAPVPAPYRRVAGTVEEGRVATRSLLAFADGFELALREGSLFAAEEIAGQLSIRLEAGEAWADFPERTVPLVVRTPHATVTSLRAGVNVRIGPTGTTVTVAHGTVTVAGSPFRQEISREETIDVSPDGALGKPLRIDPAAALAWAVELRGKASLLLNGGFEEGFLHWTPGSPEEAEVRLDRRTHAGRQSAFVRFNAVRDYVHEAPASDPIAVPPGTYRLTGYAEFADLEVGPAGGIALEVRGPGGFGRSTPRWSGSSGWRKFTVDFDLPPDVREVRVVLTRARNGSATQGTLRLDDLALFPLPRGTD